MRSTLIRSINAFCASQVGKPQRPYHHFDDMYHAFVTVFIIMTMDDWTDIMFPLQKVSKVPCLTDLHHVFFIILLASNRHLRPLSHPLSHQYSPMFASQITHTGYNALGGHLLCHHHLHWHLHPAATVPGHSAERPVLGEWSLLKCACVHFFSVCPACLGQ